MGKSAGRYLGGLMAAVLVLGMTGCGQSEEKKATDTKEVANDYYVDLTELGMNLTIYLRLEEDGNFLFSNTVDFATNKSSGTFQESEDEYIMVYETVNGEEKSVSDGLTSSFVVTEDGSLDFTGCDYIYYGSAKATTTSDDNPDAQLIAVVIPEDYDAPDTESEFQVGSYEAADMAEDGVTYLHTVAFYEDDSYMHMIRYEQDGQMCFWYETGTYGVNTTQLALEPDGGSRISCDVVDAETLQVSVYPDTNAQEREKLEFTRTEEPSVIAELSGNGEVTGENETFDVKVKVYADGSYEATAADFTETGILSINTANGYIKQYPDHPETSVRGLKQVATVPAGTCSCEGGKLTFNGLRVRKSAGLARYECTVVADK
ncbi:MAG: hypothetical protein HFG96_07195 [Lachnospiraceae bacterium]|jgi:hypothetical protein|nr:hypothetical protein [Lachnospiraceae bacterium]